MEFLSRHECFRWCRDHGYVIVEERLEERRNYPLVNFTIPADAGARVALCRLFWGHATGPTERERLVWTKDWSIWPSGEHMPLAARLRQAFGETRSLDEAPGCLCSADDHDDGLSVLVVNCLFLWDCWVLSETGAAVFLSHDELGVVFEPDDKLRSDIASELRRRRLTRR